MKPTYPRARTAPTVDILHGQAISDPYRWLEDGDSPETREWTRAQNELTERELARYPGREGIRQRLAQLLSIGMLGCPKPARGRLFFVRREDKQNQPVLYVRHGVHGEDRVLVDPNALDEGGTTALDWFFPTDDGTLLAYGLSTGGSEVSVLHVMDVASGDLLPDRIPRTRSASLAWLPDNTGFYYTRYPAPGDVSAGEEHYHRAIHFHLLGTDPSTDPVVFTPPAKEHWPGVSLSPDGRWLLIINARTFDQSDVFLLDREAGGGITTVVAGVPALFDGQVLRDRLFLRTDLEAPTYRVFAVDPRAPARAGWREIVAARPDAVLESVHVVGDRLVLSYLARASSRLEVRLHDGSAAVEIRLPGLCTVSAVEGEWDGSEVYYGFSSFTVPPTINRLDLKTGEQSLWDAVTAAIDPTPFEVRQVEYSSRDGTSVTMFLVHRKGLVLDGGHAAYLTAYGGFNLSLTPTFMRSLYLWLERGGIVAIPNIRGGGEYGERWHRDGMLGRKQNSFDDFIAAAEWLVREGYTTPNRLAIAGGSNGGLLMGAAVTQRPDLFRVAIIQVPLLDMLRYHRFLIARLWIPEYGSADDPEQFQWLAAYSPYHRIVDGTHYPAILLATAEGDTRVDPLHARKAAARWQAASASSRPVLLRLESQAGHGAGKPINKVLDELTDTWTFVFKELDL